MYNIIQVSGIQHSDSQFLNVIYFIYSYYKILAIFSVLYNIFFFFFLKGERSQISFLKINFLFLNFFLAALGLHCCTQAFSSCGERGLLFTAVHRLLIAVASLVAGHRL